MANKLPYLQLYVGDYLADTAHLTALEHGAYLMLLMNYWQRGEALPDNDTKLARIARTSSEEWQAIKETILEFFTLTEEGYRHSRIDRDIAKIEALSETKKEAANTRWKKDEPKQESKEDAKPVQNNNVNVQNNADAMHVHNFAYTESDFCNANKETRNKNKEINNNIILIAPPMAVAPKENLPSHQLKNLKKPDKPAKDEADMAIFDTIWKGTIAQSGLTLTPSDKAVQAKACWEITSRIKAQFGRDGPDASKTILDVWGRKRDQDRSAGGFWKNQPMTPLTLSSRNIFGQLLESMREAPKDEEFETMIRGLKL